MEVDDQSHQRQHDAANSPFWKALAMCVLIAGSLDILDAFIFYGIHGIAPALLLKVIASGLLGKSAFQGGLLNASLGLLIHYVITLYWAALFLFAAPRWKALVRWPVLVGLGYDALIHLGCSFFDHRPS